MSALTFPGIKLDDASLDVRRRCDALNVEESRVAQMLVMVDSGQAELHKGVTRDDIIKIADELKRKHDRLEATILL